MKKIYSLLLAAACVAGAVVAQRSTATDVATAPKAAISVEGKQLRQLAPVERTKSAQSAFSQTARLEVATTARLENATITGMQKADDNPTIEGSWTFSLGDYYFQTSVNGTITYTYEATLEGSDVWFDDPTGNELPFVAQYDEAAGKLTFKREYLGSTGQYHVYQEPFVYNYTTNDLDLQDIVGTYNATAGKITFNADNGISWAAYSTAAGSGDPLGYFSIYDLESAVKAQAGGDSGDDDWEYVGDATFVDAWILPSYSMSGVQINPNDHPYKVQLHRNLENENLYRLWEPYKNSMLSTLNQVSPDGGQIVFDITDPDHVIVKAGYRAGFANSNGDFYLFGLLGWQIYGYGNSYNDSYLPGIIEFMEQHDQEFDVLEGNVLTIHPFFDFDASCESAYSWTTNPYVTTITFPDGVLADLPDTDTPEIDGIIYQVNRETMTAEVTGCTSSLTNLNIPETIRVKSGTMTVTSVAASAFYGNRTITSATIPATIEAMGTDAFRNVTNLRTLNIADLAAWCAIEFANGNANPIYNVFPTTGSAGTVNINGTPVTTTLTVPEGVTSIGRAFYGFKSLTDVTLPTTLVTLGDQAFTNCTGLTKIEIPEGVTTIGSAFFGCSNLAEVTLPSTLTTLKGSTFYNCSSLTSIVLPEALETIGAMTFNGCSALTEIISPAAVPPTAGVMAFDGVDKEIPVYVLEESIEAYKAAAEWKEFTNYQRLIFTEIEQGDIYYSLDVDALTATVTGCAETLMLLNIPATVTSQGATYAVTAIAESAFAGNANFISAVIPASITAIDADAFKGLTSLATLNIVDLAAWCGIEFANGDANPMAVAKNVYIGGKSVSSGVEMPETVTALSAYAFYGAKTLSEVTLPATLETIGAEAFSGCTGLTLITSNATVPPTAGTGAFTGVDKTIPVMVPAEAVEAYKTAAEWKEFTNYNNESGIASIIADGAEAEYYNLNGVRVDNPSAGVYIRKQGNTVTKVIVK
ncbi:MAG: leucine-rich repeat protein [Duncaniella sp.]|nr:leucine-rich repeat protein [Duncaniella sp.]